MIVWAAWVYAQSGTGVGLLRPLKAVHPPSQAPNTHKIKIGGKWLFNVSFLLFLVRLRGDQHLIHPHAVHIDHLDAQA